MQSMIETITAYLHSHSFESEGWGNETVLDQLNQVYWESRESVSPKFKDGFQELGRLLETLPLDDNSGRTCCANFFSVHKLKLQPYTREQIPAANRPMTVMNRTNTSKTSSGTRSN